MGEPAGSHRAGRRGRFAKGGREAGRAKARSRAAGQKAPGSGVRRLLSRPDLTSPSPPFRCQPRAQSGLPHLRRGESPTRRLPAGGREGGREGKAGEGDKPGGQEEGSAPFAPLFSRTGRPPSRVGGGPMERPAPHTHTHTSVASERGGEPASPGGGGAPRVSLARRRLLPGSGAPAGGVWHWPSRVFSPREVFFFFLLPRGGGGKLTRRDPRLAPFPGPAAKLPPCLPALSPRTAAAAAPAPS